MGAPPFRLLAITPPDGPVDASVVQRWAAPEVGVAGVAVLLREIERPQAALDGSGRLSAIANAARLRGHAVLWSAPVSAVLARPWPVAGIDGVQVRGDPSPTERAAIRRHVGAAAILGRSVHGEPVADASADEGPSYTVFAPVFDPRTTAPGRPSKKAAGIPALRAWVSATPHVFALGGVGPDTAAACVQAGAWGLAGIRSFFADDASDQVTALARAIR